MRCGRGQLNHSATLNVSDLALLAIVRNQRGGTPLDARLTAGENTRLSFGWSRGRLPTRTPVAVSCVREVASARISASRRACEIRIGCVVGNPVVAFAGTRHPSSKHWGGLLIDCGWDVPGYSGRARASIPRASPAHRHRPPLSAICRHHRDFDAGCSVATDSTVVARGARSGRNLRGARPGCSSSRRLRRSAHAGVR